MPFIQFILIACLLIISACTQTTEVPTNQTRKTFTSISTGAADFAPKVGQSFAWYTPPITWATTGPTDLNNDIEAAIIETIEHELISRGFTISKDSKNSDYIIGMVLTTDDYNKAENFAQYFNLYANLSTEGSEQVVKALIGVVDSKFAGITPPPVQALLWKADLETEILELGTEPAVRIARAKNLTVRLLDSLPKGK